MDGLTFALLVVTFLNLFVPPISGAGGSTSGVNNAKPETGAPIGNYSVKNLREGHPLNLECKIEKKGKEALMKVKWFKDNTEIMPDLPDYEHYKIQENSTLTIAKANVSRDVGLYRCETDDHADQPFEINVFYLTYKKLPKSVTVLQGDKLSIACDVVGTPKLVITWSWTKDSGNVDESTANGSRYHLVDNDKHIPNATYVIDEAQYEDRGHYTCTMSIGGLINYTNTTTYVRVKDMYAALWPFLGICVEVFILCLIIFIYEKRRAKADFEESDTDQPPEQKNKPDQNKDVRQRK